MGYKTILVLSGITKKEELNTTLSSRIWWVGSVRDIQFPLKCGRLEGFKVEG
jgi:hypothetical protein